MHNAKKFKFIGRKNHEMDCTILENENGSRKVCFIFPGRGYTVDRPVLHYSTIVMLQNGIDVVHVNYNYKDIPDFAALDEDGRNEWICDDMNRLVDTVLSDMCYEDTIFLGKSLGTFPIVNSFGSNERFVGTRFVILTPLLHLETVYQNLLNIQQKSLFVIGDKDPVFDQEKINRIRTKSNLKVLVVENADHSLEIQNDAEQSVLALRGVIHEINEFIKN